MALSVKLPFAGLFRGFFRQAGKQSLASAAAQISAAAPPIKKSVSPAPASAISSATAQHGINHLPVAANEIEIPLASIISGLPSELRAKIMSAPSVNATIRLQTDAIVSQLGSGTVKISFGELRRLAPGLIANSGGEHDRRTVNLPLPEILARLNPALLTRHPVKKVSVADDIAGPFADRGLGVKFTANPIKAPAVSAPTPPPSAPTPVVPAQHFNAPPLEPSAPISFAPRAITPTPTPLTPAASPRPFAPASNDTNHWASRPTATTNSNGILVSLAALAENWPAELQQEISQPPFVHASISLPETVVESGLKRGRVTMTWQQLRTLADADSTTSPNDAIELQLPLKIIAPLFLTAKKNSFPAQTKVTVKSEIPDLFFGFPQPTATAPVIPGLPTLPKPQPTSSETNYFVTGVQSLSLAAETVATVHTRENVQTDFSSRQATPKEVIAQALALPGVAGAVVALPDGLRVASEVPTELNADTLAAFLPQIFERVNQSTRELRMGALNNVSFTVGNVPWKIFRVNSVYFAAFGRAGENLPSPQLVQLAAQIDRKK